MARDLRLLPRADKRIRLGHAWVFSNEVDNGKTPLTAFAPGEITVVRDAYGKPIGTAYVNPGALICARLLTSDAKAAIDEEWWFGRIRRALDLRDRLYPTPHYRAVYGESDGCPGLIVDRYGDVLVAQLNTAGTVHMRDLIVGALRRAMTPRGILLRTTPSVRQFEGIDEFDEPLGDVPDIAEVHEENAVFSAPLRAGQKTGYFYDQRDNRSRLARYVRNARVLDVYSYIGAWGVRAAKFGASSVTCLDSSEPALNFAQENARRNGVELETVKDDAIDALTAYANGGRRFDVVIVDPPALIKRRKDIHSGQAMYARLNRAAMLVLEPGGILISSSCSHHMTSELLQRTLLSASKDSGRRVQILEKHSHAPDHPIHPAMPETEYLKAFFLRV